VELGFELRTSSFQIRHTARATPPAHFVLVILEMDSHQLFAQVGSEP
jgi:hypothetical protein